MNCPYCNSIIQNPGSAFCSTCGQNIEKQTEAPKSTYNEVNTSQPQGATYQQPVYQQPVYQQPAYQQPVYQQPAYQQPAYQQPAYQQSAYQQPVYTNIGKPCQRCGHLCDSNAAICVNCGMSFKAEKSANDKPQTSLKVVSFLVPLVGLILYITKSSEEPISAKAYGKWALIGFILNSLIVFFSYFFLGLIYFMI